MPRFLAGAGAKLLPTSRTEGLSPKAYRLLGSILTTAVDDVVLSENP
jgi:hypothetical protein